MTMALSKLLLSILQTEYKKSVVEEWVTSREAEAEDGTEAHHTTSRGAIAARIGTV